MVNSNPQFGRELINLYCHNLSGRKHIPAAEKAVHGREINDPLL
jgi:hypothetical protein